MNPKTLAHIYQLQPGDRFYLTNDRSKSVWQLDKIESRYVRNFKIKFADCVNDLQEQRTFRADRSIIYLRSKQPSS